MPHTPVLFILAMHAFLLADLPPIPPSFDEPAKDGEAVASSGQEDLP